MNTTLLYFSDFMINLFMLLLNKCVWKDGQFIEGKEMRHERKFTFPANIISVPFFDGVHLTGVLAHHCGKSHIHQGAIIGYYNG